ncbi:MAG: class I tRNA ligase family protein [Minisyncoccia bacterium]
MYDFKKTESKILKFWKDNDIFQKSMEQRKGARPFVFYEGPPTANGTPHIGHLTNIVAKDIYGRYKTMRGFYVLRRAGWDTHGLPVEIEVEKQLDFKSKKDIEEYGIAKFNKRCRESVWKYKAEWERLEERIGYWLDTKNPYITYDPKYMESVWWIIQKIADKKLLYQGHKVVPYCPRCESTLSSHEVAQGYRDITETSVYIKFKIKKQGSKFDKAYLLAWTTTPWTLPGNVALAVGENIDYVEVEFGGDRLILAKELIKVIPENSKIISEFKGKELLGLKYEPLFNIPSLRTRKSYQVYPANFVTTDEGTGIVHTAVMYGEEDYELGMEVGLPAHHTVDEHGNFTAEVPAGFAGKFVKNADAGIVEYLRTNDLLFKAVPHLHTYPFCWRCDTPLLYYAKNSWFIKMSSLRDKLVKNNEEINWVPEHVKEGRFGEFIREAKDWALSRERYWATPLPIWRCGDCHEILVVGSLEELEKNRFRPKNTYYLLRHGESTKNTTSKIEGGISSTRLEHDKYDLTQKGLDAVKTAARKLKKIGKFDLILASPFIRTKHTAQIISEYLGIDFKIDKRLKEIDCGSAYEGRPVSEFPKEYYRDFYIKRGDGESWHDVKVRVTSLIKELEERHEGKNILLISHGDPTWMIEGVADGRSDDDMVKNRGANYPQEGQLRKIEFKNLPLNDDGNLDLHRPYVDEVYLKCKKCGKKMSRILELADVWFDSGSMPLAQWHYPFENKKLIDSGAQYPADYIAEAIDQTRGWFYTMLAIATASGRKTPYKNVIVQGHILDAEGKKMAKSKGNAISPDDLLEKVGADATRWFFFTSTTPGDPRPVVMKDFEAKFFGFISTLMNTLRFFELYLPPHSCMSVGASPKKISGSPEPKTILDKWIDARLNNLISEVTADMDKYDPTNASRKIEDFVVNDLSNWWVRRSRRRFQKPKDEDEKIYVASFLREILLKLSRILAPFTPFVAEEIHASLHRGTTAGMESVHLHDWPASAKAPAGNAELVKNMAELRNFVTLGLALRKEKQLKVRQPLASIILKRKEKFDSELEELAMDELNVKKIDYDAAQVGEAVLDEKLTEVLLREGLAREIMRQIQDLRKEAKYKLDAKVACAWDSENPEILAVMEQFDKEISEDTLLSSLTKGQAPNLVFDIEKDFDLAPGLKIWLGVKR